MSNVTSWVSWIELPGTAHLNNIEKCLRILGSVPVLTLVDAQRKAVEGTPMKRRPFGFAVLLAFAFCTTSHLVSAKDKKD